MLELHNLKRKTLKKRFLLSIMITDLENTRSHISGTTAGKIEVRNVNKSAMLRTQSCKQILLVDAANAFNSVNKQVLLHNIFISCPSIAYFVKNCYRKDHIASRIVVSPNQSWTKI